MRTTTSSKVINKSIPKTNKSTAKKSPSIKARQAPKLAKAIKAKVTPTLSAPSKDTSAPQNLPTPKHKPSTSKQQLPIDLLSSSQGASITELIIATGWQAHSLRGVISGVLRNRLKMTVMSEVDHLGVRRYRIVNEI